jgi:glycyl-tRNA synthetase
VIEPAVAIERICSRSSATPTTRRSSATASASCSACTRVAPVKAAILPLVAQTRAWRRGRARSTRSCAGYTRRARRQGQIGRRYRRQDEIGTPWAFTVDEQTLEDETVTVRDRDSLAQERLPIAGVRAWLDDALERDWRSPQSR